MSTTKDKIVDAVLSTTCIKMCLTIALFGTWIGLTFAKAFKPELDISSLVPAIKYGLAGLGLYHALDKKQSSDGSNDFPSGQVPPQLNPPPTIEQESS